MDEEELKNECYLLTPVSLDATITVDVDKCVKTEDNSISGVIELIIEKEEQV